MSPRSFEQEGRLQRLACPVCRGALSVAADSLRCDACGALYPIEGGVPNLKPVREAGNVVLEYAKAERIGSEAVRKTRAFALARDAYRAVRRAEAALRPATPLDPEYHLRRFQERWTRPEGRRVVLDVGGGATPHRDLVSDPGDEYWVLEVDRVALGAGARSEAVVGDVHELPFQDGQFDRILLSEVLEHLYDPARALAQCARALKPGGLLLATTPQYWHIHGWPSDYYRYTSFGLRHLCKQSGLDVLECAPMGGPFQLLYSVLILNFLGFARARFVNVVLDNGLRLMAWGGDSLFFRNNLERANPDTRGWALLAQKPVRA